MTRESHVIVFIVFIVLLVLIPVASGNSQINHSKIFFDLSTQGFFGLETDGPAGFNRFKQDIEDLGYSIDDNFASNKNLGFISKSTLDERDTIVVINPKRSLEIYESSDLNEFIENGGNLIVICDSLDSIYPANQILSISDISFKREYLLDTKIGILKNKTINLKYSIPVEYSGSDRDNLFTINGTANFSKDILLETEQYEQEKTILIASQKGKGKVIALGSKEPLTNHIYSEDKELVYLILRIIESDDITLKPEVTYTPLTLEIPFVEDKVSVKILILENTGKNSVSVSIVVPEIFEEVLVPIESTISLSPEEAIDFYFIYQDKENKYGYIETEILLEVKDNRFNDAYIYKIPVKVVSI